MLGYRKTKINRPLEKYDIGGFFKDNGLAMALGPVGTIANVASKGKFGSFLNRNAGAIGSVTGGAVGTAIGGPAGTAIGSSVGGMAGGILQEHQEGKDNITQQGIDNYNFGLANEGGTPIQKTRNQGLIFAKGGRTLNANAELEKGEPYRTPDGKIHKVSDNARSHSQGGEPMMLPDGTEILGKTKIMGTTFKKLGSTLKKVQDKADKTIYEPSNKISRDTALLNLKNTQKKWDTLMEVQTRLNNKDNTQTFAEGGQFSILDTVFGKYDRLIAGDEIDEMYAPEHPNLKAFNKKYGTNYVSYGDFTKYKYNKDDAGKDQLYLNHMLNNPSANQSNNLRNRAALAETQSSINSINEKKKFQKGGKIKKYTEDDVNVIERRDGKIDEGYANLANDSTAYNYFYNQPDSMFEMSVRPEGYEARSYMMDRAPIVYDKNNPLPMKARFRTFKAINNLKNTEPTEYANGGKLPKYDGLNGNQTIDSNSRRMGSVLDDLDWLPNNGRYTVTNDSTAIGNSSNNAGIVFNKPSSNQTTPRQSYTPIPKYSNSGLVKHNDYTYDPSTLDQFWKEYPSLSGGKRASKADLDRVLRNNIRGGGSEGDWDTIGGYKKFKPNGRQINGPTTPMTSRGIAPANKGIGSSWKTNNAVNPGLQGDIKGIQNNYNDIVSNTEAGYAAKKGQGLQGEGWGNADYLALGAAAIPGIYNMGRGIFGKADSINANDFQNPYENEALNTLKNRRFDIDPLLYSIKESNRMADFNSKSYGGGKAEVLSRMQGNAINRNRSIAEAYAMKNNMENQYKGDYSQALMGAGANRSNLNWQVAQWNKQAQSAKDNLFATGLSQTSQGVVDYVKHKNMMRNDAIREEAAGTSRYYDTDTKTGKMTPKKKKQDNKGK